jgi:UDP-GlcNAc:undecaprenyl-phosphate GlcNAc-1-phosphate transferase
VILGGLSYYYATYGLVALGVALLTTPLMRALAFRVGALDTGTGRRVHDGVVPRLGGGGIFLGVMVPLLFVIVRGARSEALHELLGILLAATIIFLLGVYDDLRGAPIWKKLSAETVAALVIWSWGIRIEVIGNPLGPALHLGWLGLPVTVLWVVVITNAINLVDGLDGLAATTGILIAAALIVFTPARDHLVILACMVLVGSLLGFLGHNFPPATIFMGDSGSLFVGFLLAALSIVASAKATAMTAVMLPILAFAHPLMEMVYAVLRRYHRGLPLGTADREHIHHKLLAMGLSKRTVLSVLTAMNLLIAGAALFVTRAQLRVGLLPLALFLLLVVAGLRLFGYVRVQTVTAEYLALFLRGRDRRRAAYLVGRVREKATEAGDLGALRDALEEMVRDAGCERARLELDLPGLVNPVFSFGPEEGAPALVAIEVPILSGAQRIGTFHIYRRASAGTLAGAADIVEGVSAAVSGFFERQRAAAPPAAPREPGRHPRRPSVA